MTQTHFVYFADPMCSWCYGFSPVMTALADRFQGRIGLRLVMGGLRAGNTRAMREQDKDYIRGAWTRVGETSGQPFDFSFFDREGFVYDTEPACRAVVAMRRLAPRQALGFMSAIQRAFYARNEDVTQTDVLARLAQDETGIDQPTFSAEFLGSETRNETFRDFLTAQDAGVQGFPCLVVGTGAGPYALVTNGFRPIDGLPEAIETWLSQAQPPAPS
jgi:putative protein-disulfide isomerase